MQDLSVYSLTCRHCKMFQIHLALRVKVSVQIKCPICFHLGQQIQMLSIFTLVFRIKPREAKIKLHKLNLNLTCKYSLPELSRVYKFLFFESVHVLITCKDIILIFCLKRQRKGIFSSYLNNVLHVCLSAHIKSTFLFTLSQCICIGEWLRELVRWISLGCFQLLIY